MNRFARLQKGFTLVELLMVVAITLILLALIMPMAGEVRKTSESTRCVANLRATGAAALRYFADRGGAFLPTKYWEVYPSWGRSGKQGMRDYLGVETSLETIDKNAGFQFDSVITCPSLRRLHPEVRMALHRTYTYNYYLNERDPSSKYNSLPSAQRPMLEDGYRKLQVVEQPGRMWMFADGASAAETFTTYSTSVNESTSTTLNLPHRGRANFVFLDGHVESLSAEDIRDRRDDRSFWGRRPD